MHNFLRLTMERFCRGCLIQYDEPAELLEYTEKNRRLFIYSTGIQVKRNDTFTFQLCKDCYINMKQACKFKKMCRISDKKFKTYLSLKEIGDAVDLCTYLKNNDDNNMLKFPSFAASSTPRNQKTKDGIDDLDESTCTSIGNFMTDILQGEEMPDTEARIIRQVIEEEADILDDSLDSHWLQDDVSIDNDFRIDFNFSPFSSPQSVTNGHYYTPSRLFTPNRISTPSTQDKVQVPVQHKYVEVPKVLKDKPKHHVDSTSKKIMDVPNEWNQETNIIITDNNHVEIGLINTNLEKTIWNDPKQLETNLSIGNKHQVTQKQSGTDLETEPIDYLEKALLDIPKELNQESNIIITYENQVTEKQISTEMVTQEINVNLGKDFVSNDKQNEELPMDIFEADGITGASHHNIEDDLIILEVDPLNDEQITKVNNKNYYVDNLLLVEEADNDKLDVSFIVDNQKEMPEIEPEVQPVVIHDSIDKNLQNALKGGKMEIRLEDLLTSPAVLPSTGVLSTPSIHNLVFGDISEKDNYEVNLEKRKSRKKLKNKHDPLDIFKDNSEEFNNAKLGSVSSIEKIFFGEKLDEDSTLKKQYPVDNLTHENEDYDENNTKFDLIEKTLFGENWDDSKTEDTLNLKYIEGSYIEALDEFFNARDMKLEAYSGNEMFDSGTRYDTKTCEEMYDFEKRYCKVCKKQLRSLKALWIHSAKIHKIVLEKRQNLRICEICGTTIKDPRNFTRHMQIHEGPSEKHKCEICQLSFKFNHHLVRHKLSHMNAIGLKEEKKKHSCPDCGLSLASSSALKVHRRKHTLDYVVHCTVCEKGFYTNSRLATHMRNHTGEKPYKCSLCPKAFKQSTILNKHMKTHTGERRYNCDHCLGSFVHKESLVNHFKKKKCRKLWKKKKQTYETFECAFCYRMVSGLSGLLTHQRLSRACMKKQAKMKILNARKQKGERKYSCDHCLTSFVRKESLVSHYEDKKCRQFREKKKQTYEMYECAFCNRKVSGLNGLLSHQRLSRKCMEMEKQARMKKLNDGKQN